MGSAERRGVFYGHPAWPETSSSPQPSLSLLLLHVLTLRERGGEGEKHGTRLGTQPATNMCPDWESNLWLSGSQARAPSTEPHQPGPNGQPLKSLTAKFLSACSHSLKHAQQQCRPWSLPAVRGGHSVFAERCSQGSLASRPPCCWVRGLSPEGSQEVRTGLTSEGREVWCPEGGSRPRTRACTRVGHSSSFPRPRRLAVGEALLFRPVPFAVHLSHPQGGRTPST